MLPLAFAPFHLYPLAVLALAVLFGLWRRASAAQAFRLGFLFGVGQFGVGVSWVFVAIHEFGQSPVPLAVLLTGLFVAVLALYPAVLGYLGRRFGAGLGEGVALLLWLPALWTAGEWLRADLLGGFPWLNLGYSQIDAPLAGLAPVWGVFGITWAVGVTAGAVTYLFAPGRPPGRRWAAASGAAVLWFGAWLLVGSTWTRPAGEPLTVSLVQGNLPQLTKWEPKSINERLDRYAELSLRQFGRSDLVVWPENAVTLFYHQIKDSYFDWLAEEARSAGTDLLVGVPVLAEDGEHYYTGIMSLGRSQAFYFKNRLVPFGEYVPLEGLLRGLIGFFDLPMSSFIPGPDRQPPLPAAGYHAAPSVCYEDAFGASLAAGLAGAELLVNGSNNAWYGNSLAPHQHLQISRMRALETGRPMARATTNGISALIDAQGRIVERSPQFATHVVTGSLQPMTGLTPYGRWTDWPVLGGLLIVLVGGVAASRRRHNSTGLTGFFQD